MFRSAQHQKNLGSQLPVSPNYHPRPDRARRTDAAIAVFGACFVVAAWFVPSEALMAANARHARAKAAGESRSSAVREGRLHHCVDWQGAASFQDAPCGIGQRTVSVRRFRIDNMDPALQKRSREIEQEMDRRNRTSTSAASKGAGKRQIQKPRSACETAKLKRLDTLERVGLKRTFELLSRLDRDVWQACKGL